MWRLGLKMIGYVYVLQSRWRVRSVKKQVRVFFYTRYFLIARFSSVIVTVTSLRKTQSEKIAIELYIRSAYKVEKRLYTTVR